MDLTLWRVKDFREVSLLLGKRIMLTLEVAQTHFQFLHVKIILQGGGILRFTPLYTSPNEGNIL